jgi:hypothetical protein
MTFEAIISAKGFSLWIRALGGVDLWKYPRVENLVQLSLYVNYYNQLVRKGLKNGNALKLKATVSNSWKNIVDAVKLLWK